MDNTIFIILGIFVIFWLYCISSVISNKFKDKRLKVFWTIGLIFVPFLAFFYIFKKNKLLED